MPGVRETVQPSSATQGRQSRPGSYAEGVAQERIVERFQRANPMGCVSCGGAFAVANC